MSSEEIINWPIKPTNEFIEKIGPDPHLRSSFDQVMKELNRYSCAYCKITGLSVFDIQRNYFEPRSHTSGLIVKCFKCNNINDIKQTSISLYHHSTEILQAYKDSLRKDNKEGIIKPTIEAWRTFINNAYIKGTKSGIIKFNEESISAPTLPGLSWFIDDTIDDLRVYNNKALNEVDIRRINAMARSNIMSDAGRDFMHTQTYDNVRKPTVEEYQELKDHGIDVSGLEMSIPRVDPRFSFTINQQPYSVIVSDGVKTYDFAEQPATATAGYVIKDWHGTYLNKLGPTMTTTKVTQKEKEQVETELKQEIGYEQNTKWLWRYRERSMYERDFRDMPIKSEDDA